MARRARLKMEEVGAWYHLYARAAGRKGEYPLGSKRCRYKVVDLLKFYSRVYFVQIAGFTVMGNHYHMVARFEDPYDVPRDELMRRARILYPNGKMMLKGWTGEQWEKFRKRLFDVSEFMRNFQAAFARWFNAVHERKGRFWGDRFKSTLLEDEAAVMDCLLYIELNPVRAGIVKRPEDYEGSSVYLREIGADRWMIPIKQLMFAKNRTAALRDYKAAMYYRGNVPTKEGQAVIPSHILKREEARGFSSAGAYKKRLRHFVDGIAIGSEEYVRGHLRKLRETGNYLRRKNPLKAKAGDYHVLREQRTTEVFVS
jgi:REP element-mobilizing transposase RayT